MENKLEITEAMIQAKLDQMQKTREYRVLPIEAKIAIQFDQIDYELMKFKNQFRLSMGYASGGEYSYE